MHARYTFDLDEYRKGKPAFLYEITSPDCEDLFKGPRLGPQCMFLGGLKAKTSWLRVATTQVRLQT